MICITGENERIMSSENNEAGALGRFGYVSDYDPKRHMARIEFPDKEDLVSAWLPVAVSNTKKNKDECHLDIGEHVFCAMMGNGIEAGVVLCSIYDDTNKPPTGDADIRKITFEDGTEISYDRKNKVLTIEGAGDIEVYTKGNITIKADGDMTLTAKGNMKLQASQIDLN